MEKTTRRTFLKDSAVILGGLALGQIPTSKTKQAKSVQKPRHAGETMANGVQQEIDNFVNKDFPNEIKGLAKVKKFYEPGSKKVLVLVRDLHSHYPVHYLARIQEYLDNSGDPIEEIFQGEHLKAYKDSLECQGQIVKLMKELLANPKIKPFIENVSIEGIFKGQEDRYDNHMKSFGQVATKHFADVALSKNNEINILGGRPRMEDLQCIKELLDKNIITPGVLKEPMPDKRNAAIYRRMKQKYGAEKAKSEYKNFTHSYLEEREDHRFKQLSSSGDKGMTSFLGANHRLEQNIKDWNQANPNNKISMIVVSPNSVAGRNLYDASKTDKEINFSIAEQQIKSFENQ